MQSSGSDCRAENRQAGSEVIAVAVVPENLPLFDSSDDDAMQRSRGI
jgi:hypothetical protein